MSSIGTIATEEKKDRIKSAIITLLASLILLLLLYFYKFTRQIEKQEVTTTMRINFGDNTNGNGSEEPKPQEGSPAPKKQEVKQETVAQPEKPNASAKNDKIITGTNKKVSVPKTEKTKNSTKNNIKKASKSDSKTSSIKDSKSKSSKLSSTKKSSSSKKGNGDDIGNAAIGNLIRGRGSKSGSQGNGGDRGNAGDPLGGDSNGDSRIGKDRKLIKFIPGTMGRGGKQPSHNCTASGNITIAYVVDKAGNVVSANRVGGITDPCVVSTTIAWVKQYVKAERASTSSKGTYKIIF